MSSTLHTDQLANIRQLHEGEQPKSWLTGDTNYQKAAVIAAAAWHNVKDPEDPELTDCALSHRTNLIGICESLMRGNLPDESAFAQHAFDLWRTTDDYTKARKGDLAK